MGSEAKNTVFFCGHILEIPSLRHNTVCNSLFIYPPSGALPVGLRCNAGL